LQKAFLMSIEQNLGSLKKEIPQGVTLVAISKTHPPEVVMQAYNLGQRVFGENKVQELISKYENLPKDIIWHLVGHLQTNKVKYIAPFVNLIHSVDSLKLLKEINKGGVNNNRVIDCLLQIHIAEEETKFGLSINEVEDILNSDDYKSLTHIRIVGLMGMATFTDDMIQIRKEFKELAEIFKKLEQNYFSNSSFFNTLSMGMSSDYRIAIEEGSTMIRVGSNIFGERDYVSN
jgi:PLP dependent protein